MGTRAPGFAGPAWARFRANRRGWFSLWIFAALYLLSLCAPLVSREPGGAFPVPPLFKSGPHTVWGPEEIEPWLRPVRGSGGRWPVAAAEYAPGPGETNQVIGSRYGFFSTPSSGIGPSLSQSSHRHIKTPDTFSPHVCQSQTRISGPGWSMASPT